MRLRPEGGVDGSEMTLFGFQIYGPARRAEPDNILLGAIAHTNLEIIGVNFWAIINVNLDSSQSLRPKTKKLVLKVRSYCEE